MARQETNIGVKSGIKEKKIEPFNVIEYLKKNLGDGGRNLHIVPVSNNCFRCNWFTPVDDDRDGRGCNVVTYEIRKSLFVRCSVAENGKVTLSIPEKQ